MSLNQKEGVFSVVSEICKIENSQVEMCPVEKSLVIDKVCVMFEMNEIDMSDNAKSKYIGNRVELRKYVGGLVNNWLRKDTRLNGGEKYVTKNPGSRTGTSDSVIKNLKLLRSTLTDDSKIQSINEAIDKRTEEIRIEKNKNVEIDMSVISDELKKKLGL